MIDKEEYNDLDAEVVELDARGRPIKAKFKKDKFYMKDMHPPELSEQQINDWFDWLKQSDGFTYSQQERDKTIESIPILQERPSIFSDQRSIYLALQAAEVAEEKMKEADLLVKQKRKDRLKLFDNCLREYLNIECKANYKIKYDK